MLMVILVVACSVIAAIILNKKINASINKQNKEVQNEDILVQGRDVNRRHRR